MSKFENKSEHDSQMRWAIALALEGEGMTSPNPMVGAVVVKNNKIIGEGFHAKAGSPHAEINALREAHKRADGADLYVTLEPCCHYGRTPPCVDAILAAGIRRVFIGTLDPNPLVSGRGAAQLRNSGVEVTTGILEDACRHINLAYNKWITTSLPYVTIKAGLSLDGKIALKNGDSKWITNEQSRAYVHKLRMKSDAILVGVGTVIEDDPLLTVRMKGFRGKQPQAVVLDASLRTPVTSKLLKRPKGSCIFAVTEKAAESKIRKIEKLGHGVLLCKQARDGKVSLPDLLKKIGKLGINSLFVEGGGEVFSTFISTRLVDRVVACIAPKLLGGEAKDFLPKLNLRDMRSALVLSNCETKIFGDNVLIEGELSVSKRKK